MVVSAGLGRPGEHHIPACRFVMRNKRCPLCDHQYPVASPIAGSHQRHHGFTGSHVLWHFNKHPPLARVPLSRPGALRHPMLVTVHAWPSRRRARRLVVALVWSPVSPLLVAHSVPLKF